MLGNFDVGEDVLQGKQKDSIMEVVNWFGKKYGFSNVVFHRDKARITCPGNSIDKSTFISDAKAFKKEEKIVMLNKSGKVNIITNNKAQYVPGEIINNVTYIYIGTTLTPLREACETLGLNVTWDRSKNATLIK